MEDITTIQRTQERDAPVDNTMYKLRLSHIISTSKLPNTAIAAIHRFAELILEAQQNP